MTTRKSDESVPFLKRRFKSVGVCIPSGRAERDRHLLGGSSTVNTALKQMLESGDVDVVGQKNAVADPLFAAYLRQCGGSYV